MDVEEYCFNYICKKISETSYGKLKDGIFNAANNEIYRLLSMLWLFWKVYPEKFCVDSRKYLWWHKAPQADTLSDFRSTFKYQARLSMQSSG